MTIAGLALSCRRRMRGKKVSEKKAVRKLENPITVRIWNFSRRPEVPVTLVGRTIETLLYLPPFDDDQAMIKNR